MGRSRRLESPDEREERAVPHDMVRVRTTDGDGGEGDEFEVRRALLRPCIAMTGAVRGRRGEEEAAVDVDTLTFDRILIFLENMHLGKEAPDFAVYHLGER